MIFRPPFSIKTIPVFFLLVLLLAFGLLIPSLGLYWDDWPVVFIAKTNQVSSYWQFYEYDRPFSAWTYVLLIPLLGVKPLVWQIFTLLLRWGAVCLMWVTLNRLWPKHTQAITWAAVLFAIYPIFDQQPVSIAYSQHWICYILFFLSIWAMLKAEQGRWWLFTLLALLAAATELWTMEYFVGLDLIRPLLLFILVSQTTPTRRGQVLLTLKKWVPYLMLWLAYVLWRIFVLKIPGGDPNTPVMLSTIVHAPLDAVSHLFQAVLQDVTYTIAGIWFQPLQAQSLSLARPIFPIFLVVAILSATIAFFYMQRLSVDAEDDGETSTSWSRQVIIVGIISVLLGILPAWMIDRQVTIGLYGSRFAFAAMFGASLLMVGVLEWLRPRRVAKILIIAVLIGIAVNYQLRISNQYRDVWEKQRNFYWQLHWRAPYIQPGTAIISDQEIFSYVGMYSTSMAITLLYPPQDQNSFAMPLWFFSRVRIPASSETLLQGTLLQEGIRNYTFAGQSENSIAINYQPEDLRCLWVLSDKDADNKLLSSAIDVPLQISNLSRIKENTPENWQPNQDIFGEEPSHQWCFYYQKAELARQYQKWDEIVRLGHEAEQKDLKPLDAQEWFPFVEGYAHTGKLDKAYQLTVQIRRVNAHVDKRLCNFWYHIISDQKPSPELSKTINHLNEQFDFNLPSKCD